MSWAKRKDLGSEVRAEIMEAIAADDVPQRTLLKIMLMVLDDIGGKIDAILRDENGLRQTVLNGHTEQHEAHHDWVASQMAKQSENAASGRRIRDGLLEKILWAAIVGSVSGGSVWLVMR